MSSAWQRFVHQLFGRDRLRQPSPMRREARPALERLEDRTAPAISIVADINANPNASSSPSELTNYRGLLYFTASDPVNGLELWRSDGTASGTFLVKDINPGSSFGSPNSSYPSNLTVVNGTLFFTAYDSVGGRELWKSNGTPAGTVRVKDINPGSGSSYPSNLTNVNGVLYFTATDGTNGTELWRSNGTAAGTFMVKDIRPGSRSSYPYNLTSMGGVLYFTANDGTKGTELWRSNGTAAGTFMIKDIRPGGDDFGYGSSSYPSSLTNVGGTLYFAANDGVNGRELWKSNGTAAGTVMVKDIRPGFAFGYPRSSYPYNLTNVGGTLYFTANDGVNGRELWKSNGTDAGTVLVKDVRPGSGGSYPSNLTNVGGRLFFTANNGINGTELWRSNGTEAGTALVKDIRSGFTYGYPSSSWPSNLTSLNGLLYFTANDGINGREVWRSNGTTAGTFMVQDINTGSGAYAGSYASGFVRAASRMFFSATDGSRGFELWASEPPVSSVLFPFADAILNPNSWAGGGGGGGGGDDKVITFDASGLGDPANAVIEVTLRRLSDGRYWNGTSFSSTVPVIIRLTQGQLTYTIPESALTHGTRYVVRSQAIDTLGLTQTTPAISRFTWDVVGPVASFQPIRVKEDSPPTVINLRQGFRDAISPKSKLTFGDVTWDNFDLIANVTLDGNLLTVTYRPDAIGTATIRVRASDEATNATFAEIPVFVRSGLTPINEDNRNSPGDPVASGLSASFKSAHPGWRGVAVTSVTGNGTWQYSLNNGLTWKNFPAVSNGSALLLGATDRVRFVPTSNWHGQASLTYRAWFMTTGVRGGTGNVSGAGFGATAALSRLTVVPVNDRPSLNLAGNPILSPGDNTVASLIDGLYSDPDDGALRGIAITSLTGTANGSWQYSTTNGSTWLQIPALSPGAVLLLRDTDLIRFVPNAGFTGTVKLMYRAWDQTAGQGGKLGLTTSLGTSLGLEVETAPLSFA